MQEAPGDQREREVDPPGVDAAALQDPPQDHARDGDRERDGGEVVAVEDGDDEDRAEVVDDGEGQQERPQGDRQLGAHHREHGEGEGDVGRHGDAPPAGRLAVAQGGDGRDEEQRGHGHAGQRGDDRDDRLVQAAQAAQDELVLELEAGDEEEHREQAVGRPHRQRQVEVQRRGPDHDLGQGVVALAPRRVGPDQRDHRGEEQERAADRLLPQRAEHVRPLAERQPVEDDLLGAGGEVRVARLRDSRLQIGVSRRRRATRALALDRVLVHRSSGRCRGAADGVRRDTRSVADQTSRRSGQHPATQIGPASFGRGAGLS